jgi:hypothetical protein
MPWMIFKEKCTTMARRLAACNVSIVVDETEILAPKPF